MISNQTLVYPIYDSEVPGIVGNCFQVGRNGSSLTPTDVLGLCHAFCSSSAWHHAQSHGPFSNGAFSCWLAHPGTIASGQGKLGATCWPQRPPFPTLSDCLWGPSPPMKGNCQIAPQPCRSRWRGFIAFSFPSDN